MYILALYALRKLNILISFSRFSSNSNNYRFEEYARYTIHAHRIKYHDNVKDIEIIPYNWYRS